MGDSSLAFKEYQILKKMNPDLANRFYGKTK
jgi:hypothetical protein